MTNLAFSMTKVFDPGLVRSLVSAPGDLDTTGVSTATAAATGTIIIKITNNNSSRPETTRTDATSAKETVTAVLVY